MKLKKNEKTKTKSSWVCLAQCAIDLFNIFLLEMDDACFFLYKKTVDNLSITAIVSSHYRWSNNQIVIS